MEITTGRIRVPRRVAVYGVEGVGKSTFAAGAPDAIFIPTEEGTNDLDVTRFPICSKCDDALDCIAWLYKEEHDYKWVVLDSADWLETLIHRRVAVAEDVETIASIDWGKGYELALTPLRQILEGLDALRTQRGMYVLILAHAEIELFRNPEGEDYHRYRPKLHRKAAAVLVEWCDDVLFAGFDTATKAGAVSFGKKTHKAIGDGKRVLWTDQSKPTAIAKNRLGLPPQMPLDFQKFFSYL